LDHREPDPVLDGTAGIQVLELREQRRLDAAAEGVQADDRRVADELEDGGVVPGHCRESVLGAGIVSKPSEGRAMKIAVGGKGNVGGGLADRWERAGHEVTRIGRDGGDVSDADVVLLAVPGGSVVEAFEAVSGWDGKTVIDTTNLVGAQPPDGFASNTEYV